MDISTRTSSYRKADAAITSALFSLLETKDFHKISVSDIIKKAKINRSTFYRHYVDKYDILDHIKDMAAPLGEKMISASTDNSKSHFDLLFNSDYLKRDVPEHYKKTLLLLMKVRTENFDMEKIVKAGFASQYKPGDTSYAVSLERELYSDVCYRLLIRYISDEDSAECADACEILKNLVNYICIEE